MARSHKVYVVQREGEGGVVAAFTVKWEMQDWLVENWDYEDWVVLSVNDGLEQKAHDTTKLGDAQEIVEKAEGALNYG